MAPHPAPPLNSIWLYGAPELYMAIWHPYIYMAPHPAPPELYMAIWLYGAPELYMAIWHSMPYIYMALDIKDESSLRDTKRAQVL